jgi:hypothetical protein
MERCYNYRGIHYNSLKYDLTYASKNFQVGFRTQKAKKLFLF